MAKAKAVKKVPVRWAYRAVRFPDAETVEDLDDDGWVFVVEDALGYQTFKREKPQ